MNEELRRAHEERWNTLTRYAVSYVREVSKPTDYATDDDARWALVRELEAHTDALSCVSGYTEGLRPYALALAARDTPPSPLRARALEIASGEKQAEILAVRVLEHVRRLLEKVWVEDLPPFGEGCPLVVDGVVWWVEGLAAFLEGLGPAGRDEARAMRDEGKARSVQGVPYGARPPEPQPGADPWHSAFHRFLLEDKEGLPRWVRSLARVVWEDEVKAEIEHAQEIEARKAGGIGVLALARRDAQGVAQLRAHRIEQGALVADGAPVLVPYVSIDLLEAAALRQLGSSFAPRLLEWQAATWHSKWLEGDSDANVRIPGGWAGFADHLGLSSEARRQLEPLCRALVGVTWTWDTAGSTGRYPLLGGFELRKSAGRRSKGEQGALLTITLSELFRPPTARGIHGQRLVPIVALPDPRRCGVSPRYYGLVDSLHRRGVLALVDSSDHLRRFGGVEIEWEGLADEAFRPHVRGMLASDGWLERWERCGERWTLRRSPETARALDHLLAFAPKVRKGRKG